jgi:TolA-binding protein
VSAVAADRTLDLPPKSDKWNEVRTQNFTLYGDTTVARMKEVGLDLEKLRAVLLVMKKTLTANSPVPTSIYVFKTQDALDPYLPPRLPGQKIKFASYFLESSDGNYIALTASWNDDPRHLVYHNYIYYFLSANYPPQPTWFEEGIGGYYSTFRSTEDEAQTGMVREDYIELLRNTVLIPLDRLFAIDRKSPEYHDEIKRDIFDAESWALVHYLMRNPERTPQLGRFLTLVQQGRPNDEAFHEAFQMEYPQLFSELVSYVRNHRFTYNRLKLSDLKFPTETKVSPMSYDDVVCRLGEFLAHQRDERIPEAERYFQAVLASNPSSAPAFAGLGYLRDRQKQYDDAYRYLQKAIAAGSTDFRVYFYAGRVRWDEFARETHSSEALAKNRALLDEARADFRKSVELNPEFPEAQAALGRTYLVEQGPAVDDGIAALEIARKKLPSREDVAADLAALYDLKGDKTRGDAVLKSAGATETLAKRGQRSQLEASLEDVNKLLEQGKDDEALALFDGMIAKSSGEIRTELESQRDSLTKAIARNRAVKAYNAAIALYNKRDYAGALTAFQKIAAEKGDPDIASAAREKAEELSRRAPKKAAKP